MESADDLFLQIRYRGKFPLRIFHNPKMINKRLPINRYIRGEAKPVHLVWYIERRAGGLAK